LLFQIAGVYFFQMDIVIVIEIINAENFMSERFQFLTKM
jgi:hypothetical protein